MRNSTPNAQSGYSLVEMIITLALFGLMCFVAISNLQTLENPLVTTSTNLTHYFRLIRVRGIAQTRSIRIVPTSSHYLTASTAKNCTSTTFDPLPDLDLDIGDDVSFTDTDWEVCFTQRGLVQSTVAFEITDGTLTRTVEIALGGGVQIQ